LEISLPEHGLHHNIYIYHKELREEILFCQNPGCNPIMADIKDWRTARRWVKSQRLGWQGLNKRLPRAILVVSS